MDASIPHNAHLTIEALEDLEGLNDEGNVLGQGSFGVVRRVRWRMTPAAAKVSHKGMPKEAKGLNTQADFSVGSSSLDERSFFQSETLDRSVAKFLATDWFASRTSLRMSFLMASTTARKPGCSPATTSRNSSSGFHCPPSCRKMGLRP